MSGGWGVNIFSSQELIISNSGYLSGKAAKCLCILGRRDSGWSSTSALGDVAQYLDTSQASVNSVDVGTTYYIVSTSGDDTNSSGTGVRKIRITYLDSSGNQQVSTVNLAGTVAVSIGSGYTAFQWMETSDVGSGGVAAGDIAIGSINGAQTVASTVRFIKTGGNKSMGGEYTVPTGYSFYIAAWHASAINANMDVRLRATVFTDNRAISTSFHFQDTLYIPSGQTSHSVLPYLRCPAGSKIKVSAIPQIAAAGNRCDAVIDGICLED